MADQFQFTVAYINTTPFDTIDHNNVTNSTTDTPGQAQVTTLAEYYVNVVYVLIGVIGSMGNVLVLIIIFSLTKMRKKLTNIFIINQCITDVVAAVSLLGTTLHFWSLESLDGMHGFAGELLCRLWLTKLPLWASLFASTLNLVAVTIERFLEVVHPISHKVRFTKEKAILIIALMWILSFAFQGSWIIATSGLEGDHCILLGSWRSDIWRNVMGFINVMLQFFIPIAILTYCYCRMALALNTKIAPLPSSNSTNEQIANNKTLRLRRNMFKTLVTVSAAYGLCWVTNQTLFLLYSLGYQLDFSSSVYHFSIIMVFANCCINPFIYAAQYKQFQNAVSEMMIKMRLYRNRNIVAGAEGLQNVGLGTSGRQGLGGLEPEEQNPNLLSVRTAFTNIPITSH